MRDYQRNAVTECWKLLKKNDEPVLMMASVGSGKSLMISDILLSIQKNGKKALCIVNNAELVRNNCETFIDYGGEATIYCAALKCRDSSGSVVFGTPKTIISGIDKNEKIASVKFNIIIVDEAHNINFSASGSCFLRIFSHYKREYPEMRLLGATGTNFRFRGAAIVGSACLFKSQCGNITTEKLIKEGFLIDPVFEVDKKLIIDFSKVEVKRNGLFDQKQLNEVIDKNTRLTELICRQIVHIVKENKRFGVFIFATSKKHAYEILTHLPKNESGLILGDTPQEDRIRILNEARTGKIRYLVNISIISVGVDVPAFDTVAYLRPTESLVLLVQTIGRVLRLSPGTNKLDALVLDFAGNIERHKDWDNPILLKAVNQTIEKDRPLVIICPDCKKLNTEFARRCTGIIDEKRCDYYFEFKECPSCSIKNDIASRECRICHSEIIDPNKKLKSLKVNSKEVDVIEATYGISGTQKGFRVNCLYKCKDSNGKTGNIYEHYSPVSEKARMVFYGQFVKKHCKNPSEWYMHLQKRTKIEEMLGEIISPVRLMIKEEREGYKIKRKYF